MTDEELIARLRSMHWCVTTKANGVGVSDEAVAPEAADRIETLLNLNEALVELMDDRDAKLTKVVEALRPFAEVLKGNYSHQSDGLPISMGHGKDDLRWVLPLGKFRLARATIAEIKGESHDPL